MSQRPGRPPLTCRAHLEGGDVDGLDVAAELLAHHLVTQQLLLHPLGVGLRLVALVHRHNHRHCHTTTKATLDIVGRTLRWVTS